MNNALNFNSTPTDAKKQQAQAPDKTALEKIIQGIAPAHAAGALTNPQDKEAAALTGSIRNSGTDQIVITTYGVYAAGLNAPLAGGAAKSAVGACMANPSGCTVLVTQAAEAGGRFGRALGSRRQG